MRSTPSDSTTRAQIRDAALVLFGSDGFERTTIRGIAAVAGVSAGLVIHHFGGKDALRAACDDYVVERWFTEKNAFTSGSVSEAMSAWQADVDRYRPFVNYFATMITDGTAAGDHLFDRLVAEVETYLADGVANGSMTENSDPRMLALVITIYGLAPLIMQRQLGRVLGGDVLTDTIAKRMTLPVLELYTHGLYTDDSMLRAAREVLASDTTNREEHGQ
jgi:TetR/AcrR family transcriptional regulator, regulator of cefoperazone and chloramphenicol sensitivity